MPWFRDDYMEPEAQGDLGEGAIGEKERDIVRRSTAISLKRIADWLTASGTEACPTCRWVGGHAPACVTALGANRKVSND